MRRFALNKLIAVLALPVVFLGAGLFIKSASAQGKVKPLPTAAQPTQVIAGPTAMKPVDLRKKLINRVIAECLENIKVLDAAVAINKKGKTILETEYQEMYIEGREPKLIEKRVYEPQCYEKIRRGALRKFLKNEKSLFTFSKQNRVKMDEIKYTLKSWDVLQPGDNLKYIGFKDCEDARKFFTGILDFFNAAKIPENKYNFNF